MKIGEDWVGFCLIVSEEALASASTPPSTTLRSLLRDLLSHHWALASASASASTPPSTPLSDHLRDLLSHRWALASASLSHRWALGLLLC